MIQPPSTGPTAGAVTTVKPYSANAIGRCLLVKLSAKMLCSVGARPPPPIPCSTRKNRISGRLSDRPQPTELSVNSATQPM